MTEIEDCLKKSPTLLYPKRYQPWRFGRNAVYDTFTWHLYKSSKTQRHTDIGNCKIHQNRRNRSYSHEIWYNPFHPGPRAWPLFSCLLPNAIGNSYKGLIATARAQCPEGIVFNFDNLDPTDGTEMERFCIAFHHSDPRKGVKISSLLCLWKRAA